MPESTEIIGRVYENLGRRPGKLVGQARVGDDAAPHRGDRGAGRRRHVPVPGRARVRTGGDRDLVEQVDELLHGTDEVAGGEAGYRVEYVLELGTAGPAVGRPDEAGVGLAQERKAVPLLQVIELAPGPRHGGEHVTDGAVRQPRGPGVLDLPA